jgi:hypothetical protein
MDESYYMGKTLESRSGSPKVVSNPCMDFYLQSWLSLNHATLAMVNVRGGK